MDSAMKEQMRVLPLVDSRDWYVSAMEYLVDVVQDLSHARDMPTVVNIVRHAARSLTGADGATFVLRDQDKCLYVDEDALEPLWKGARFPMSMCISGWVMNHAKPVIIEDIFQDPRIPTDVYRKTFVKSMAMVPIRMDDPVGAIGNYWAHQRCPTDKEVAVLQALANVTAVAIENIGLYEQLEGKIKALEISNDELNRFAWAASHDLKSPLRAIDNLAKWIEDEIGPYSNQATQGYMNTLHQRVHRMEKLLNDMLDFAQVEHQLSREEEEFSSGSELIEDIKNIVDLNNSYSLDGTSEFMNVRVQRQPMTRILLNLIGNSIKHHDKGGGHIRLSVRQKHDRYVFSVQDDGPGIPEPYHAKVFDMFQTILPRDLREASGMGLSIVKKIVNLYGGEIWVEKTNSRGATLSFTWPRDME